MVSPLTKGQSGTGGRWIVGNHHRDLRESGDRSLNRIRSGAQAWSEGPHAWGPYQTVPTTVSCLLGRVLGRPASACILQTLLVGEAGQ